MALSFVTCVLRALCFPTKVQWYRAWKKLQQDFGLLPGQIAFGIQHNESAYMCFQTFGFNGLFLQGAFDGSSFTLFEPRRATTTLDIIRDGFRADCDESLQLWYRVAVEDSYRWLGNFGPDITCLVEKERNVLRTQVVIT